MDNAAILTRITALLAVTTMLAQLVTPVRMVLALQGTQWLVLLLINVTCLVNAINLAIALLPTSLTALLVMITIPVRRAIPVRTASVNQAQ
jgi:hypothetical protein